LTVNELPDAHLQPTYRSGTAARLAGIPVETLRVWERRYGVVGPRVNPRGHRIYSAEDVSRLALLKQLVGLGSPIGSIAALPLAALHEMRNAAGAMARGLPAPREAASRPIQVALVGEALAKQAEDDGAGMPALKIVAACTDVGRATEALRGTSADVLAIELPTLQAGTVAMVDALVVAVGARQAVVGYRFGPAAIVGALRDGGHVVTRSPLELRQLERLCGDATSFHATPSRPRPALPTLDRVPGRRFDDHSLAVFAQAATSIYCECPHHVVELLLSLGAFERYSAECENRSPADAALHRYLQRVAGSARALFEEALVFVARSEGLPLPGGVPLPPRGAVVP